MKIVFRSMFPEECDAFIAKQKGDNFFVEQEIFGGQYVVYQFS